MNKRLSVLIVLLGFGLVGCATTSDGKLVSNFKMQVSHNVDWWFGEEILANYQDITLRHKVLVVNKETSEEYFFATGIDVKNVGHPINSNTRKNALDLCEWYAKPQGYKSQSTGKCYISMINEDKYIGNYVNGEFNGQGKYTFANGDKYIGNFKDGMFHGQGTMYWVNGKSHTGEFYRDQLIEDTSSSLSLDLLKSAGELVLGGIYIAVAVVGSPEFIEYQQSKQQDERIEKLESTVNAVKAGNKTKQAGCVLNRNC